MADSKISELNPITGSQVEDSVDFLAITDNSASETKKISREQLFREVTLVNGIMDGVTIGGTTQANAGFLDTTALGTLTGQSFTNLNDLVTVTTSLANGLVVNSDQTAARITFNSLGSVANHVGIGAVDTKLALRSGNANRMFITSTGNVGIGTSIPDEALDVRNNGNTAIKLLSQNNTTSRVDLMRSAGRGFSVVNQAGRFEQRYADSGIIPDVVAYSGGVSDHTWYVDGTRVFDVKAITSATALDVRTKLATDDYRVRMMNASGSQVGELRYVTGDSQMVVTSEDTLSANPETYVFPNASQSGDDPDRVIKESVGDLRYIKTSVDDDYLKARTSGGNLANLNDVGTYLYAGSSSTGGPNDGGAYWHSLALIGTSKGEGASSENRGWIDIQHGGSDSNLKMFFGRTSDDDTSPSLWKEIIHDGTFNSFGDPRYLKITDASTTYLPLTGGTITGGLTLNSGNPSLVLVENDTNPGSGSGGVTTMVASGNSFFVQHRAYGGGAANNFLQAKYVDESNSVDYWAFRQGAGNTIRARMDYASATDLPSDESLVTRTRGDTRYLLNSAANSDYLKITDASTTYLSIANANSDYLKITDASTTYLALAGGTATGTVTLGANTTYIGSTSGGMLNFLRTGSGGTIRSSKATYTSSDALLFIQDTTGSTVGKFMGSGTAAIDANVVMTREKADNRYPQLSVANTFSQDLTVAHTGDTILTVKSTGTTGDSDAILKLDAFDTGESQILFYVGGNQEADLTWVNESAQLNLSTAVGTDSSIDFQPNGKLAARVLSHGIIGGRLMSFYEPGGTSCGHIGEQGGDMWVAEGAVGIQFQLTGADRIDPFDSDLNVPRDGLIDLGGAGSSWDDVWSNGVILTSDANKKTDVEGLDDAEMRVALACKKLLRKFKWKASKEVKGDEARWHFGIMAQELAQAFEDEGLDAGQYGMFISSEFTDPTKPTTYGVRYVELLAFIIAAI